MSTYEPIASQTLGSAAATVTFSSIPQGYTDLVLVANLISTSSARVKVRVGNGSIDTGSNYSYTILVGNGTSASSGRESSITELNYYWNAIPSGWSNYIIQFQNYSNATTYKTVLGRGNSTAVETFANVGLWRSTSAINIIEIRANTGSFDTGSTFSIYGIQVGQAAQKAQGGNIVTTDGTYVYHTFTSSGAFIPSQALTVDYLVVAGGGGGGADNAGGGGAGGLRSTVTATGGGGSLESALSLTAKSYPVIIGAGGAGATNFSTNAVAGSDSIFSTITSTGGGKGANSTSTYLATTGGSGGGASGEQSQTSPGSGTTNQGFAGGNGSGTSGNRNGGGGGGAGAVGGAGSQGTSTGGAGGAGVATSITGSSVTRAGGGGGMGQSTGGTGAAGGGNGATTAGTTGGSATVNTGSGGGGGNTVGGNGGSGVVVIRYAI